MNKEDNYHYIVADLNKLRLERVRELLPQIKPNSYWKHSRPDSWVRYIHFTGTVSLSPNGPYIQGSSLAVFIDLKQEIVHRSPRDIGYGSGAGITWKESNRTQFDFWYNLAGGSNEKS